MGILDTPAIPAGSEAAATTLAKLALGVESVVINFLGDSTTVVSTRPWPKQIGTKLGAMFPAYTVIYKVWSDGSQTYDAGTTLQTGTGTGNAGGPYTLTLYNGGVSGSVVGYPITNITRFNAMLPVTPDLIFLNASHNSNGATGDFYRSTHYPLIRILKEAFPQSGIISIAQNPRSPADTEYSNGINRVRVVKTLSANEGLGVVNIMDAFLAIPNYWTTLYSDMIHPNEAGMDVWANAVMAHLRASRTLVGRTPFTSNSRLWVPASDLKATVGTATAGIANGAPSLILPDGADTTVAATVEIPQGWQRWNINVVVTTPLEAQPSGAATVAWRSYSRPIGNLGRSSVNYEGSTSGQSGRGTHQGSPVLKSFPTATGLGAWPVVTFRIVTDLTPASVLTTAEVARIGTDAGDTCVADAHLLGLLILRER